MHKTYVNALVYDKGSLGIDPVIRNSLKTYYQRNLFIDKVEKNPPFSIVENDEDTCLKIAADAGFDYIILTYEGNIFDIYRYHDCCVSYINQLDEKTNERWLVAGHLMNQFQNRRLYRDPNAEVWKDSFWLFPITAVVNLKVWRELGCPKWGQQEDGKQTVVKINPSEESVHDGYTPLFLNSTAEQVEVNVKKGWNIINESIKANITVYNLNNEIRNEQNYLYPEVNVERYNNFWSSVFSMPKLTDQYKRVLEKVLPSKYPTRIDGKTWQCFIKNTEDYFPKENIDNLNFKEVDTVMLPSSGFKDFILTMNSIYDQKPITVIHFDIISQCIEIKRKMITRWDGSREEFKPVLEGIGREYRENPQSVFHMHAMKDLSEAYDEILRFFDSEEDLKTKWAQFKSLNHKYIESDMLDDPYNTLKLIDGKNVYLCLSDIAGWRNNIIGYGYQNLRNNILRCLFAIRKRELNCIVDYKDPATDLQVWQNLNEAIDYLKATPVTMLDSSG